MARSSVAAAMASLCLLTAAGSALGAHSASYGGCKSASTSSYNGSGCHGGKYHSGPGMTTHVLFYTARHGHCRGASLSPSSHDLAQVRAATLCLINRERARHGERALHWNVHLLAAAQAHTESMAFGNYFQHVGPHGVTPLMRMHRTGYIANYREGYQVAENIAWGSLWLGTPKAIVSAWMRSPGHRANILDPHYRDTGIGISPHTNGLAHGQRGGIYTQDFGVIVS